MKNTFGQSVAVTIFGESHGEYIGAVLDGIAPGIDVDEEYISEMLTLRRPAGKISTARHEMDKFKIVSGVANGKTTGTPLTMLIPNENVRSGDYTKMRTVARPSHADYTAECKYHGYQDSAGGGHFSGRITAALVGVGAICRYALEKKGIIIGTHIKKCGGVNDRDFRELISDIHMLNKKEFAVLDDSVEYKMKKVIMDAAADGDSVGGVLETSVTGIPVGVGEPWFDSVESQIAHIMFSVPAIKGIEFGAGFGIADMKGSVANDAMRINDGRVISETNHNGGINGGITNGMPIIFRTAVKPTPTIFKPQNTVDFKTMENTVLEAGGRHDPAIVHRVRVVQDAVTAIAVCDMLSVRFGTDWLNN